MDYNEVTQRGGSRIKDGMKLKEQWKTIVDFPDYAVSNMGNVKRLSRAKSTFPGKMMNSTYDSSGYLQVKLQTEFRAESVSRQKSILIHHLVLGHFGPPRPVNSESNHKDCQKSNNNISNLEWVSHAKNMQHASSNGLLKKKSGHDSPFSRLKRGEVWLIKRLLSAGIAQQAIAQMFCIHRSTIQRIKHNRAYREKSWA